MYPGELHALCYKLVGAPDVVGDRRSSGRKKADKSDLPGAGTGA
jgi:hypothetical protein